MLDVAFERGTTILRAWRSMQAGSKLPEAQDSQQCIGLVFASKDPFMAVEKPEERNPEIAAAQRDTFGP